MISYHINYALWRKLQVLNINTIGRDKMLVLARTPKETIEM